MESLRKQMGGIYRVSHFVLDPNSSAPSTLPLRPFALNFLDRFEIIGPSPPQGDTTIITGSAVSVETVKSQETPLDASDAAELQKLATAYSAYPHAPVPADLSVNSRSRKIANGGTLSSVANERALLASLRYRKRECARASAITESLDWTPRRPAEEWCGVGNLRPLREAEARGCKIASEFVLRPDRVWKTMSPAMRLAEVWETMGRPEVLPAEWDATVVFANTKVEGGFC
ncbi:hypothetical protein B0H10DRAFT_811554 [Mycena sp. CBHHK59/15]|nr:hypothetical protein B0H10DRAFT_811554 [Mycena sp. CBHHK59/15]